MMETKNNQSDKVKQEAIELLKEYESKEREIKDKQEIIDQEKKELGKRANKELNLEQTNKALQNQIDHKNKINKDIAKLEIRLEDLKKQNEVLQNELDQIIKTNKNNMFERKVIDIIDSLHNEIQTISSDFSKIGRAHV